MADTLERKPRLAISTSFDTEPDPGVLSPSLAQFTAKLFGGVKNSPKPLRRNQTWGDTMTKDHFDDIESLESGTAREYLSEECLSPTSGEKRWTNCYVEKIDRTRYKLYSDVDQRFLLSAKCIEGVFYISQYESFPDDTQDHPTSGYCAVLRKMEDAPHFKLFSTGCEFCDGKYFTCGHSAGDDSPSGCDRQLLADIQQFTKRVQYVDADMRCLNVVIPAVMKDKRTRVVWCPRSVRNQTPKSTARRGSVNLSTPTSTPRGKRFGGFNATSNNEEEEPIYNESAEVEQEKVYLKSKLPEWNEELKSLVLKFNGGRVLAASSKNFMLAEGDTTSSTAASTARNILQFGKSRKGKFVLDYRYPMAPVQAFGICLSSCAWAVES